MEKELKIAELAALWGVSVPTTWNRIRKEGLTTFIKKNESNKEVNYVKVTDEIINQYVINDNNNVNNIVNNGYYEDMLTNNNIYDNVKNPKMLVNAEYTKDDLKELITTITTVNNDYNNRLETLTNRLITAESKQLLLEDKASREGLYINEINDLKKDNNRYKLFIKLLITVIVTLLIVITGYITFNIGLSATEQNSVTETQKNPVQAVTPTPELSSKGVKK
jgi:hypothetical protein